MITQAITHVKNKEIGPGKLKDTGGRASIQTWAPVPAEPRACGTK